VRTGDVDLATEVIAAARERSATLATAESLTGGLVCAALVDIPGASDVVRGGVVAYAVDVKVAALGVPADLVERLGTVHESIARAMAEGARQRLGATHAVATTGVAGPDPSEGRPVGTVHVTVAGPEGTVDRAYSFEGDRPTIRRAACQAALILLRDALADTA
jgi:nicotinamide-nucleotide amidase